MNRKKSFLTCWGVCLPAMWISNHTGLQNPKWSELFPANDEKKSTFVIKPFDIGRRETGYKIYLNTTR